MRKQFRSQIDYGVNIGVKGCKGLHLWDAIADTPESLLPVVADYHRLHLRSTMDGATRRIAPAQIMALRYRMIGGSIFLQTLDRCALDDRDVWHTPVHTCAPFKVRHAFRRQ